MCGKQRFGLSHVFGGHLMTEVFLQDGLQSKEYRLVIDAAS